MLVTFSWANGRLPADNLGWKKECIAELSSIAVRSLMGFVAVVESITVGISVKFTHEQSM